MIKLDNLLTGFKVLEEVNSPINGKIRVVQSLVFGKHIQVDNLTQSGGVVTDFWKTTLKKVKRIKPKIRTCLILGLGGGSVACLVNKSWPSIIITGVDIDKTMVGLGKKYLGLNKIKINIKIGDAFKYAKGKSKNKSKYDLILVDLYIGYEFPEKFEKDEFLQVLKKLKSQEGLVIVNRLYFGEKRPQAMRFCNKLEKVFSKVDTVFPEANIMFICS